MATMRPGVAQPSGSGPCTQVPTYRRALRGAAGWAIPGRASTLLQGYTGVHRLGFTWADGYAASQVLGATPSLAACLVAVHVIM